MPVVTLMIVAVVTFMLLMLVTDRIGKLMPLLHVHVTVPTT